MAVAPLLTGGLNIAKKAAGASLAVAKAASTPINPLNAKGSLRDKMQQLLLKKKKKPGDFVQPPGNTGVAGSMGVNSTLLGG